VKSRAEPDIDQLAKRLRDAVRASHLGRYRMHFFDGGTVVVNADTKPAKRRGRR
jgi:hypothetical protein